MDSIPEHHDTRQAYYSVADVVGRSRGGFDMYIRAFERLFASVSPD